MNNITCIVHTYNSEKYLDACLKSVSWVDEIIIVDMYSNDLTLDIAKKYKCKILMHENIGYADPARQYGVENAKNDWILAIDSDELLSPFIISELNSISENNAFDVVNISRRNFFFGKELHGSGWSYKDDIIPRFFNKRFLSYQSEIHNFIKISEKARVLNLIEKNKSFIHFNYDTVESFISRLNRYTTIESTNDVKYKDKMGLKIFYHCMREFFGRFFIKKGYKDGWLGLYLSLAMAFYRISAIAKNNLPNGTKVDDIYHKIGNDLLK